MYLMVCLIDHHMNKVEASSLRELNRITHENYNLKSSYEKNGVKYILSYSDDPYDVMIAVNAIFKGGKK